MPSDVRPHINWLNHQAQVTVMAKGEPLTADERRQIVNHWRESLPENEREQTFKAVFDALQTQNGEKKK